MWVAGWRGQFFCVHLLLMLMLMVAGEEGGRYSAARVVLRSFPRNEFLVARVVRRLLLLMQYQVRVARCNPNSHLLPQQLDGCWVLQFVLCRDLFEVQEVYGCLCQKSITTSGSLILRPLCLRLQSLAKSRPVRASVHVARPRGACFIFCPCA